MISTPSKRIASGYKDYRDSAKGFDIKAPIQSPLSLLRKLLVHSKGMFLVKFQDNFYSIS